jgi:hypothetical protein
VIPVPAVDAAIADRRLRGAALAVLVYCWRHAVLSHETWRIFKIDAHETPLARDRVTIYRALDDLRRAGYVERHPSELQAWRLRWDPTPVSLLKPLDAECDGEGEAVA